MFFSELHAYRHAVLSHVPWWHWAVIGILALALTVFYLLRKKTSVYGTICLGITVFVGLFLLDAVVVARALGATPYNFGIEIRAEWHRLLHGSQLRRLQVLANIAVFVPFGFFLSEFLFSTKRFNNWCRVSLAALCGLALSLCIEVLQLIFRLGWFEVTDLVMNTVGSLIGACLSLLCRAIFIGKERE